ncbi:MAG TPA: hypothetical protein VMP01_05460 [Pirellulaceae bacterium]|nr:hypothetical protein [Pirellulaceae bacterium]
MRFTIRDLLWLTLLAAVLVAWYVDRSRHQVMIKVQQAELVDWQEKAIGFAIDRERERQAARAAAAVPKATSGGFPGSTSKPTFGN